MTIAEFLKKAQFCLFIILSTYFSLIPHLPDIVERTSDKIVHAVGYFLLFLSCDVAYRTGKKLPGKIIPLFIFSLTMELLQHFIPYRYFSFLDLMANLAGLSVAYIFLIFIAKNSSP